MPTVSSPRPYRCSVPLLVAACTCSSSQDSSSGIASAVFPDRQHPVHLDSLVDGWRLYEGEGARSGVPLRAFRRLVLVRGYDYRVVAAPTDLVGFVKIDCDVHALEFVRLFTSLETFYLFKKFGWIEIFRACGVPKQGEIAGERYAELGLSPPIVRRDGDVWIVERDLVNNDYEIFRSRESVDLKGRYRLETVRSLGQCKDVSLPMIY